MYQDVKRHRRIYIFNKSYKCCRQILKLHLCKVPRVYGKPIMNNTLYKHLSDFFLIKLCNYSKVMFDSM